MEALQVCCEIPVQLSGGRRIATGRRPWAASGSGRESAGGRGASSPPVVIRGAQLQRASQVLVGIDWLRLTGPETCRPRVVEWLREKFGELKAGRGVNFYRDSLTSDCGASIWFNPYAGESGGERRCTVNLTGESLRSVGGGVRMQWLRELWVLGMRKATRLDVAIDFQGAGLDLVQAMQDACDRGELCGMRCYKPVIEKTSTGEVLGHTVYLGKRGSDGCGRLVRCYDKGLESKSCPAGEWHRLEVEFTGDCAINAVGLLLQADDAERSGGVEGPYLVAEADGIAAFTGWRRQAVAMVLGSMEFRVCNGSRSLERRPMAAWWAEVLAGVEVERVKEDRSSRPSFERKSRWLVEGGAVACLESWALAAGVSVEEVIRDLKSLHGVLDAAAVRGDLATRQYVDWKTERASPVPSLPRPVEEFRRWINQQGGSDGGRAAAV